MFRSSDIRRNEMKKSSLILAGVALMAMRHSANAAVLPSGDFDDSSSIVIAKAVKLGRGSAKSTAFGADLATSGKTSTSNGGSSGGVSGGSTSDNSD